MILDVKRAFLYGSTRRSIYIRLPAEDPRSGEPGLLGKLQKAMCGARDVPMVWQQEVKAAMKELEFEPSASTPCLYVHTKRDLVAVAHVDDFLVCGPRKDEDWLLQALRRKFLMKGVVLGDAPDEVREAAFLGRILKWESEGISWEADPSHVKGLLKEWGMHDCRPVTSPGSKAEGGSSNPQLLGEREQHQ